MRFILLLSSFLLCVFAIARRSSGRSSKTVSFPLTATGGADRVYTIEVSVGSKFSFSSEQFYDPLEGPGQKFNLTLDTDTNQSLLFRRGFQSDRRSCSSTESVDRRLFDPR